MLTLQTMTRNVLEYLQNEMKTLTEQIIAANIEFYSIQIPFLYKSMLNVIETRWASMVWPFLPFLFVFISDAVPKTFSYHQLMAL